MIASHPKTGDVFLVDLDPVKGSEQGRVRPVIVFQNPDLSRFTSTYLCIPLTTNLSRMSIPGTCFLKKGEGGLSKDAVALCFQLRAIDKSRLIKKYGRISSGALQSLADAILSATGIDLEE